MVEVTVPTKNKVSLYKSKMYTECTRKVDFMKNVDQSDTVLEDSKKRICSVHSHGIVMMSVSCFLPSLCFP